MRDDTASDTEQTRPILAWIWRGYLRQHLWLLMVAMVLMAVEGAALGMLSYIVEPMFDRVLVSKDRGALSLVSGAILAIFLGRALASFGQSLLTARVGQTVSAKIQSDLIAHIMTLDTHWFQVNPSGNLIERVRGDSSTAANIWSTVLSASARDVVALISLLAVALSIDWLWTLIAVAGVPLLVYPVLRLQTWVRRTAIQVRQIASDVSTRLDEIFHGNVSIKLNRLEPHESGRFDATLDRLVRHQFRATIGRAAIPAIMDIVAGLGFFGVFAYGGLQIIEGDKTIGEFMSFFTAMALVFEPLRRLGKISGAWQVARASLERLYEVFCERPTILSPDAGQALKPPAGQTRVDLRDVSMAYAEIPVLRNLSFTAEAGKVTALVGASGAGKSTVFHLLTRLVDPQSGQIEIGGTPVSRMSLETLRSLISVVSQDTLLFDETLRDNILLGRRDVSDDQLDAVLRAAHITDFLPALPKGLDSPAGPRGSNLSGGQRQRVAIARAILRNTPILLLDEATSALDAKSQLVVQQALDKLSRDRTTLVIAHRLSTVQNADKIVVMDAGHVVEQGTHDSLLAENGLYSGLYKLQFANKRNDDD